MEDEGCEDIAANGGDMRVRPLEIRSVFDVWLQLTLRFCVKFLGL